METFIVRDISGVEHGFDANDVALNVIGHYAMATDAERAHGGQWYPVARAECATIASQYGLRTRTVVAIVAVLSPMVRWSRNIQLAVDAIEGYRNGDDPSTIKCLNNNARRAYRILGGQLSDVERSPKVYAFYLSIMGDTEQVTIDRHAMEAATFLPGHDLYATAALRRVVDHGYRLAADDLGQTPRDVQAATWLCAQRHAAARPRRR